MLSKDLLTDIVANQEMFLFEIAGTEFSVLEFELKEKIFTAYSLDLLLVTEDDIEFDDVVGKDAKLTMLSDDTDRFVSGIVQKFEMEGMKGRFRLYRVTISPWLWLLNLSLNTYMFQETSTPDIVKKVLKEAGITSDTYEFRLQKTYQPRDYCVQYKETGFEFVSRLLSEEGIFYFFEFTEKGNKLIFGDSSMNYKKVDGDDTIAYKKKGSFTHSREFITDFRISKQLVTGKYAAKDYDFKEPSRNMNAEAKAKDGNKYEMYDYPGYHAQHKNGNDRSKMNLERITVFQETITGEGSVPQFSAGKVFTLEDHDIDDFNADYIIESVIHKGYQPQVLQELADTSESSSF
ncbi:MAG: type VI secretion system tip protein VgrG, partial [Desulfobacterales bacterium]|nr:type VI secretion system tip protein VgrG [Desulfobacterales bacterium]